MTDVRCDVGMGTSRGRAMIRIGYVFLDANRDKLIPLAAQQQALEEYAGELGVRLDELLVEQSYSQETPFVERTEGRRLLEHVQEGDTVFTANASWVLGTAREALRLLKTLKEKRVSFHCVDLGGDIALKAERKLVVSQGIADFVYTMCEALSVKMENGNHAAAIRAGKARQKKAGKYLGGPIPFGFVVDENGYLQRNSEQQVLIDTMVKMKENRWSYRDIAKKMQQSHGVNFSHEGIRRIVLKTQKK